MNSTTKPTCVLADDHCMFRQAIRSLLEDEGFVRKARKSLFDIFK
jgi:hypothetical protein